MSAVKLTNKGNSVSVLIPMKFKNRPGRKEIIIPDGVYQADRPKPDYHLAFVIALARAHRWQELLDAGQYTSIKEMAEAMGVCDSYMARLMRLTLLAPDIIESVLTGNEPDGFSMNKLTGAMPVLWEEQRGRR